MGLRQDRPGDRTDHGSPGVPALGGERGLTLVELMIVVVIIGIIAAIALAFYQDIQRKSRLAADQATTSALQSAVAIYYGRTNGTFPPSIAALSTLVQPAPVWQCSQTIEYTPGNGKLVSVATLSDC